MRYSHDCPASIPDDNANWILYPPVSPSTSSTSPQKKRPGTSRDSIVCRLTSSNAMPPQVAIASSKFPSCFTTNAKLASASSSRCRALRSISATGNSGEMPSSVSSSNNKRSGMPSEVSAFFKIFLPRRARRLHEG